MAKRLEKAIEVQELKIIGAGFGRTGTLTMKAALEELGFGPCYHMYDWFEHHRNHTPQWDAAIRGEIVNWKELFKGYQATTDWPACTFYQDLMKTYPDAKVLLTVRDPEKWYQSANNTIYRGLNSAFLLLMLRIFRPKTYRIMRLIEKIILKETFKGNFADKQQTIEIFNRHIEEVQKYVPPERLLVFNVKEGWAPLCAFLGVEVPKDKPFPHLNDPFHFFYKAVEHSMELTYKGGN